MVSRAVARLGADADSLLIIESLPYQESRNYVERVMANYWIYRHQFGQPTQTLDALATGAQVADIRLDRLTPAQDAQVAQTIASRQTTAGPAAPATTQARQQTTGLVAQQPPPGSLIERPLYQQPLGAAAPAHQTGETNSFR
jgi:soluble lytic murein transglycosylase-like protein